MVAQAAAQAGPGDLHRLRPRRRHRLRHVDDQPDDPRPLTHWLKALGHARGPLTAAWLEEGGARLRRTGFPRRPRMAPGDRLVYYASVWQRIFAVVEVVAEPTDEHPSPSDPKRWPWSVEVEPLLVVPHLDAAPPVQACGIPPRSMSQQSHIRMTPEQYRRAVDAIASIAY